MCLLSFGCADGVVLEGAPVCGRYKLVVGGQSGGGGGGGGRGEGFKFDATKFHISASHWIFAQRDGVTIIFNLITSPAHPIDDDRTYAKLHKFLISPWHLPNPMLSTGFSYKW